MKCYGCERTFSDPEARDKHAKKCCPELMAEASKEEEEDVVGRPHDLSPKCYVCGKTCATLAGFGFHVQGCKARYEAQRAIDGNYHHTEAARRPRSAYLFIDSRDEITLWNAAVAKQFNTDAQNMCPADRCGRTFETEAKLEQHMRGVVVLIYCTSASNGSVYKRSRRIWGSPCRRKVAASAAICEGGTFCIRGRLPFHFRSCLRRFYAIEDEKQASLQNAPPPAPAVADFGDNDVVDEEVMMSLMMMTMGMISKKRSEEEDSSTENHPDVLLLWLDERIREIHPGPRFGL